MFYGSLFAGKLFQGGLFRGSLFGAGGGIVTGGDLTLSYTDGDGDWIAHVFNASGTLTVHREVEVEYLVVAGGGGGFRSAGGAGGYRASVVGEPSGGGAVAEAALTLEPGPYVMTIGAGGAQGDGTGSSMAALVTTVGGGGSGTANNINGRVGGSGSGAAARTTNGTSTGGAGTVGQGFKGGDVTKTADVAVARVAPGGGAAAAGVDRVDGLAELVAGGAGVTSSITGTPVMRAKGGDAVSSAVGGANTGNGGGGSNDVNAAGGSGICIVRYHP